MIITDDQDQESVAIMRKLMANPYGKWFQFTDAMASDSIGGVARVSLLTGQYTHNHKVLSNKNSQKMDDRNTIATWLQESGYYTALIGKYLNGYPWGKNRSYVPNGWNHFSHLGHKDVDLYSSDTINLLNSFLNSSNSSKPFFLYLAHRAPQRPAEPPDRYKNADVFSVVTPANEKPNFAEVDMSDKPAWAKRQPMPKPGGYPDKVINGYPGYMWDTNWIIDEHKRSLQQTMAIDDSIEVLLDFLDEKGELDNTVIFYTADSGYSWGAHRRTGRGCPYEACSGIPFLVFYPDALVPAGSAPYVVDRAVSNIDMTATIVELADARPRRFPQDGTSLLPLLNSSNPNTAPWADAVLLENLRGPIYKGVRTKDWKYVEYPTGELELYDLVNDPYELDNQALNIAYRGIRNEMAAKLDTLMGRTTSSISGRVTDPSGAPLAGVVVSAGSGVSTTTASDGTYTLTGLQAGKKTLKLTKWGYKFAPGSLAVTVPPNSTGKNFVGTPNQSFIVSGVIKRSGKALAGVSVSNGAGRTVTTNSKGQFNFGALPVGVYTITPSMTGMEFGPVSEVVAVPPGQPKLNFIAATAQTYDIGGVVRDENTLALAGVTVSDGTGRTATTDSTGRYTFRGLPAGTYTLTASRLGYTFATPNTVTIGPSNGAVNFTGQTIYYSISGTITTGGATPQPVEGVLVSEPGGKSGLTNAQGAFTITGLRVGSYTLTATKLGYTFTPATRSVTLSGNDSTGTTFSATQSTYTISGRVVNSATNSGEPGVLVSNGRGATTLTDSMGNYSFLSQLPGSYTLTASKNSFNLAPASLPVTLGFQNSINNNFTAGEITYQVGGTVTDSDGLPLSGVTVSNGQGRSAITDGNGDYTIALTIGSHSLTARKTGYGFQPVTEDVTIVDQNIADGPDFEGTLSRYSISGIVRDSSSQQPLSGVTITYGGNQSVETGADGRYTIANLVPGTYVLTPYLQDYEFLPKSDTIQLYYEDATSRNFAGTYQTYSISGVVLDLDGKGIGEVTISAGDGKTTKTSSNGAYSLSSLPRGTYTLTAEKPGYTLSTQSPVNVPPNVTDYNFIGELIVHIMSGQVLSGTTPMVGVPISYAPGKAVLTNGSGRFTITDVPGTYTLTPSMNGYSFDPASSVIDMTTGDVSDIDFSATQLRYSISGFAKTRDNMPLANVVINYGPNLSVTTDGTGAYTIPNLLNGTYQLTAYLDDHVFTPTPLSVTLNYQSKTGQNLEGTLLTYSVSGTVRDSKGALMSGVTIDAGNGRTTTTVNGAYKLDMLPRGTYTLTASRAGYTFNTLSAVTVPPNVTNHDFTGTLIVWDISGVVIDEDDNPLPNVKVTYGTGVNDYVMTNGSGQFTIEDRLPGNYTVTPSRQGYRFEPPSETFNLQADKTDIRFDAVQLRYTITGLVRTPNLTPLEGVVISYGEDLTVTTDASGRYTIENLLNGSYTVEPTLDEYTFNPVRQVVTLGFANKTQNFTGTLNTYSISGTVKDALGNPMSGVTISDGAGNTTTTSNVAGKVGTYTLSGLVKGTYTLTATRAGYNFSALDPISVGPNQTGKDFTGTLIVFDITGTILDQDSNPLSGVTITYVTGGTSKTVQTEADGTYRITAVPASYKLTPSKQGYTFNPSETPVVLSNADVSGVDFGATQLKYTISGYVRTSGGAGIPNVVIDNGRGRTATTDANGFYAIAELVNDTYVMTATLDEYTFNPISPSVPLNFANKAQNFTGTQITYAVTGTVLDVVGPGMTGVTITAMPGGRTTTTGPGGVYTLPLPKGSYTLTATKAGYSFTTRDQITVPPAVSGQDFTGTLIVYNISGTVRDLDNNPLPGATINAVSGGTTKSVQTEADGSFVITTIPGLYTLTASKQGYSFGASQSADARNGDVSGLGFSGTRLKYLIRGTIQTATGVKTAGVVITYGVNLTTTTDLAGIYSIEVYPGNYTLTPALNDYTFDPPSRSVTLGFANSSANNFTLLTYAVSGVVTDEGNNPMSLVDISAGPGLTTRTGSNGAYTLLLPGGTYTLTATRAGYGFVSQTVTVPPAQTVNFRGERVTYTISGKIVNNNDLGVPGIPIFYGGGRFVTTNLAGEYLISGLTPNTYSIKPTLSGFTFTPTKRDLTISTASVSGQNFTAAAAPRIINGTIINSEGQGISGVAVWYGAAQPVFTNAFGVYATPALLPGAYVLEPALTGYSFTPVTATIQLLMTNVTQNFNGTQP